MDFNKVYAVASFTLSMLAKIFVIVTGVFALSYITGSALMSIPAKYGILRWALIFGQFIIWLFAGIELLMKNRLIVLKRTRVMLIPKHIREQMSEDLGTAYDKWAEEQHRKEEAEDSPQARMLGFRPSDKEDVQ
jgi:hypothetical protein